MTIEDLILLETARCETYKSLAECYYLPQRGLIGRLKEMENQLARLNSKALSHAVLICSEYRVQEEYKTLAIEFARLFVGPYHLLAPPYGSVYLEKERRVMGDSTMDVKKRYSKAGLDISEKFKDAPDHISAELEFMYYLIYKEIEAINTGAAEDASEQLIKQKSFLFNHLGNWVPHFTGLLLEKAKTGFYRNLAFVTRKFVAEDLDYLTSLEVYQQA